jgi:hypothetical protein
LRKNAIIQDLAQIIGIERMKIAAVLPHLEVFGGVRRYLEIGNELVKRGHSYVIFHPDGSLPTWFGFLGKVKPFSSLRKEIFDFGLCSEYAVLPTFERLNAKIKFFYFVLEGHKEERKVARANYLFLGNSDGICRRLQKKYKIFCQKAAGGVNPNIFYPIKRETSQEEF